MFLRNFDRVEFHAAWVGLVVKVSYVLDQIDHALEVFALANRNEERVSVTFELRANVIHCAKVIGTRTVHLVDESHAWNAVLVHLTPNGFRLRLHAGNRTENSDGAIKDAQRAFYFSSKVDVTRGIDNIDTVINVSVRTFFSFPTSRNCSGRNRDTTLALLLHPVGGRSAIMHFTHLVHHAGVK